MRYLDMNNGTLSRLATGRADPEIVRMTTITANDKIYLKKRYT